MDTRFALVLNNMMLAINGGAGVVFLSVSNTILREIMILIYH